MDGQLNVKCILPCFIFAKQDRITFFPLLYSRKKCTQYKDTYLSLSFVKMVDDVINN